MDSMNPAASIHTVVPVVPGFDPLSVRCAAETRLHDLIWRDEDLLGRLKECSQTDESKVETRLDLMTGSYRVDEALTPRLFRLASLLTQVLRLAIPLDIFVRNDDELNACCFESRKGTRLVLCLYSGMVNAFSSQELLFCMGHEVGHALLKPEDAPLISDGDPRFSRIEAARIRELGRAREVSCDRVGLLACQDARAASLAIFRLATGLSDKWICFDETAYARHFDELAAVAEVADMNQPWRTHPFDPLRVKALIAFSHSETYARAFGKTTKAIPSMEMEKAVDEGMLRVLETNFGDLEDADGEEAASRFLFNGGLTIITAAGADVSERVAAFKAVLQTEVSPEDLEEMAGKMSQPDFRDKVYAELHSDARILRHKLAEFGCARLLHAMYDLARSAGELTWAERETLENLRELLDIREGIATDVRRRSKREHETAPTETETLAEEDEDGPEAEDEGDALGQERLLAAVRQTFSSGGSRDREAAIRDVFTLLPGQRLTAQVREQIDKALITAAHRGIVCTEGGLLRPDCRTINDYPRELLKKHLVGVMKTTWWEEDEAIRAAARYLGFGKAGANIQTEFRSAIRGALRQGLLERDGTMIRRAR